MTETTFKVSLTSLLLRSRFVATLTSSSYLCSGPLRHQRRVFRRRHGSSDAHSDAGGVHAVSRGLLQRFRALPGRRYEATEPAGGGQQRRGRQEKRRQPLRQGQG